MDISSFLVRPASFGSFAVYHVLSETQADTCFVGTRTECESAINVFSAFLCKVNEQIAKGVLANGKAEYLVNISFMDTTDYEAELKLDTDVEDFINLIASDMTEAGKSPFVHTVVAVSVEYLHGLEEDAHGRHYFIPTVGRDYKNVSCKGSYRCLYNGRDFSVMRSMDSGWTFKAYGIVLGDDGCIEWSGSTCGRFEKFSDFSAIIKDEIYCEMRLASVMEDVWNYVEERISWLEAQLKAFLEDEKDFDPNEKLVVIRSLKELSDDEVKEMAEEYLDDYSMELSAYDQLNGLVDNFCKRAVERNKSGEDVA